MPTPPNQPPNPRLRVANSNDDRPRSRRWDIVMTAAITALAGAAAVGIGASVYKYAVKRTRRLLRKEEQQREETPPAAAVYPSYQHAVGYSMYAPAPGYPYPGAWPTASSERDRMPEALREIPNFQSHQPMPTPNFVPPQVVAQPVPPPSADPNMRRFMDDMRKRLSTIENYLQDDGDDADDDDEDDDRHAGKGKN